MHAYNRITLPVSACIRWLAFCSFWQKRVKLLLQWFQGAQQPPLTFSDTRRCSDHSKLS